MPVDAVISLEKSSPALNEKVGSFSFPFPVPRVPNQRALGWPGRLERVGDIADKSFVLEDQGLQVLRGEVEYDEVTAQEIGVVLKSGMTEFWAKVEKKKLADIDLGSEFLWDEWPEWGLVVAKLAEWDAYNAASNNGIILAPCKMNGTDNAPDYKSSYINTHKEDGKLVISIYGDELGCIGYAYFMMQFRIWWLLEKIFQSQGYTVVQDDLATDALNKAVLFTRPFNIEAWGYSIGFDLYTPMHLSINGTLNYATLMPDIEVSDFIKVISSMFCLMMDIDERRKEVRITFRRDIFLPANLDRMAITELAGWAHKEQGAMDGLALRYKSQTDELDTKEDYVITASVETTLPAPTKEGEVYRITNYMRDYIVEKVVENEAEVLKWKRIGRLKGYVDGNGEDETELEVTVPAQVDILGAEGPKLEISALANLANGYFIDLPGVMISLYQGRHDFDGYIVPYICSEYWSMATEGLPYAPKELGIALTPEWLYTNVYADWLTWRAYRARGFTKYIRLTLPQLVALQWGKRYVISGVEVLLDKISYELPFKGTVKVEGFTN